MSTYHMSLRETLYRTPMAVVFALEAAAIEQNAMLATERLSTGYIAAEYLRLKAGS